MPTEATPCYTRQHQGPLGTLRDMSRKNSKPPVPSKLTKFFHSAAMDSQDGAAPGSTAHPPLPPLPPHSSLQAPMDDSPAGEQLCSSPPNADRHKRAADSPAHALLKVSVSKKHMGDDGSLTNQEGEDLGSLASIPASKNPVSEHFLKSMILTLHKNIQAEFRSSVLQVHSRIDHVEERTDQIERQMEEVTHACNELIESHSGHAEEIQYLKAKVADPEDRSRRNNNKFRGITEIVKNSDLVPFIQQLFLKIVPLLPPSDLLINRTHRIYKPKHLPASVSRDVLARIHFFLHKSPNNETRQICMHPP